MCLRLLVPQQIFELQRTQSDLETERDSVGREHADRLEAVKRDGESQLHALAEKQVAEVSGEQGSAGGVEASVACRGRNSTKNGLQFHRTTRQGISTDAFYLLFIQ